MERELARRCGRQVRVAEFVTPSAKDTIRTGGANAAADSRNAPMLFAGYVEALYARNAWLAVRVDMWASGSTCFRQVRSSSVYLQKSGEDVALGGAMTQLHQVVTLNVGVATRGDELPALSGDELTIALEAVVQQAVEAFRQVQVQALQNASQRAKFEYDMLQHHPGLEVLVLHSANGGRNVLFALPLLGEEAQWDPKILVQSEDPQSVFTPNGFNGPNFSDSTDRLTIFIGYPMNDEEECKSDGGWPLLIEWPTGMELSSQVTQIPPSSKAQSSVELMSSCKKMFLQQWRRRKEFVAELRQRVIVFEYDAVDFAQTFFMLQEQLDAQSPLRIIVLRLQFTAAFFLTNCMGDLHVTMLDGENAVAVALAASSSSPEPADSQTSVARFLDSTRSSLLRHFYAEMN
ncbi:hypothetical protein KRP22_012857 [Phytophthora ramorum]|nr:hypothetical protein KRP22_8715 [Phytophthora ramorum]